MDKQIFDEYGNYKFHTEEKQDGLNTVNRIEGMAKDLLDFGMAMYPIGGSAFTETKLREQIYNTFLAYADYLIAKGYFKIPEGAVVLTEWEYEYFQKEIRYWQEQYHKESEKFIKFIGETFKEILDKSRKETAEKIYKLADEISTGSQNDGVNILCAIKKEFGL